MHSFGRIKGVPWWKNGTFHFFVTCVVAIAICVIQLDRTASRKDLKEVSKVVQQTKKVGQETNTYARDTHEMLRNMDVRNSGKLLKRYPLGYRLFAISDTSRDRGTVTPIPANKLLIDMPLDWNSIKIVELTDDTFSMTPPNFGNVRWENLRYQISREVGKPIDFLNIKDKGIIVTIEVLEDMPKMGIVCVMGFRKGDRAREWPEGSTAIFGPIRTEQN